MTDKEALSIVLKKLEEKFPNESFVVETIENEIFICVINKKLYHNKKYCEYIIKLKTEYLWPNDITNICFGLY